VYGYEGCDTSQPWEKFDPAAPPFVNTLTAMDEQHGYWLRTTGPESLTLSGVRLLTTAIPLCAGWNLIGYPSGVGKSVTEVLAGIDGQYDLVYAYDASDTGDPWEKYDPNAPVGNDLKTMRPWLGYWIRMTEPATLTIHSR
jgi:hypothetical protein